MIQETLDALSDPVRREIIKMLQGGDLSAGRIAERFDISLPAISRHLAVLREGGLVSSWREGKSVLYSLRLDTLRELEAWINDFLRDNE
jgi:DNA-binding transcriptional ArsR family regulator